MNLHLDGGDLVQCKVIAQLRWDIVAVHLVNPEINAVNQEVFNRLEKDGSTFPLADDPRYVLCYFNLGLT